MDKNQADIETRKILCEANEKLKQIIETAKKTGTWKSGLDANKELFVELDKETREKLSALESMIDK